MTKIVIFVSAVQGVKESLMSSKAGFEFFHSKSGSIEQSLDRYVHILKLSIKMVLWTAY